MGSQCVICFLQDAITWNQLNIAKEGGGNYIAYVWDNAYWGNQVKLYQLTGRSSYASEVKSPAACPNICILYIKQCALMISMMLGIAADLSMVKMRTTHQSVVYLNIGGEQLMHIANMLCESCATLRVISTAQRLLCQQCVVTATVQRLPSLVLN